MICASLWYTCHTPLSPHLSYQNASLFSEDSESGIFAILAQGYSSDSAPSWRNPLSAARLAVAKVPTLEATKRCFPLQGHHYQHHHPHCYGSNTGPSAPSLTRMAIFYCKANLTICSSMPCEDYRQTGISAMFWIAWSENLTGARGGWRKDRSSTHIRTETLVVHACSEGGHQQQQQSRNSAHAFVYI